MAEQEGDSVMSTNWRINLALLMAATVLLAVPLLLEKMLMRL